MAEIRGSAMRLSTALLCVSCEMLIELGTTICPSCTSEVLMPLATIVAPICENDDLVETE
jgi:hypothetical protein